MPVIYKEEDKKSKEEDGNKTIFVTSEYSQGVREESFVAGFTIIASSSDMSRECQNYAIPFLCYYTFPLCDVKGANPRPRQVCRDECEMLEEHICKKEYLIGKHHPLIAMNCYNGSGGDYRGSVNKTRQGHTCVNWLNNPYYPSNKHGNLLGNHNFCRNPNGTHVGPWCYIDKAYRYNELCSIPKCNTQGAAVNKLMFILVPGIIVPLALVLLLAIVCLCQRHRKQKGGKGSTGPSNTTAMTGLTGSSGGSDPLHPNQHMPQHVMAPPQMMQPPNYHQLPPGYNQIMPSYMGQQFGPSSHSGLMAHPQVMNQKPPQQINQVNQNGPKKISPAGSVASHQSSHSSEASSLGNYKPGGPATLPISHQTGAASNHISNTTNNGPPSVKVSDCNKFNSLMSQNSYIPEQRTAEM
ncbi:hypothetical protein KUTeg_016350 [Tegillarca granosa]|uniref:Uncharacterized protein n=1 Tax=Tegillarca granosa TaxID=220873 RepID=A0ABQ9EQX1_TEGGR|nr:hypothetical protein KUTeg_016350 [Tegillarca granosa]